MNLITIIIFFVFGTIIGSFLNVVIYRMNTGISLQGRSACMSCKKKLCWYELLPIFSFLFLGGRCGGCKTKISIQYILVEFITGLIFVLFFLKFNNLLFLSADSFFINYAYYAILFSILIIIAAYDFRHKIIPDNFVFVFGSLAFIGLFFFRDIYFFPHMPTVFELLRGVFVALPFFLLWFFSKGAWIGLGDAKLALGLGWFLPLTTVLSGLVLAFWFGAIIGIGLIFTKKGYSMKSEIPFGPYMVLGILIAFVCGLNFFPILNL